MANRRDQSRNEQQLKWEAEVVEYVTYVYNITKVHGNAKQGTLPSKLPDDIPLLGPRFLPPSYTHNLKRNPNARITPETAFLRPLNVIHPLYYNTIARCPQCDSPDKVRWDSWNNTGHRELHGVRIEENAIGYQLRCKACEDKPTDLETGAKLPHCFATTSPVFWKRWEHWEIPSKSIVL